MFFPFRGPLHDFYDRWTIQLVLRLWDRGSRDWRAIATAVYRLQRVRLYGDEVLEVLVRHKRVEVVRSPDASVVYLRGIPNPPEMPKGLMSPVDAGSPKDKEANRKDDDGECEAESEALIPGAAGGVQPEVPRAEATDRDKAALVAVPSV